MCEGSSVGGLQIVGVAVCIGFIFFESLKLHISILCVSANLTLEFCLGQTSCARNLCLVLKDADLDELHPL